MAEVILIDDDEEVLEAYSQTLGLAGFNVKAAASLMEARGVLSRESPAVVLSDVKMPGRDGFAVLDEARSIDPELPVILISGHADVSMALRAMRAGAFDFLEKPADPDYVIELLRRASAYRSLVIANRSLRSAVSGKTLEARILGSSAAIVRLRALVQSLSQVDSTVLIKGETGTGKELVARCLHETGPRSKGPFIAINCAALPHTILESELFGHEVGAFTGAKDKRIGKIELADKGTLFLDEIESMPMDAQLRLLRVLQERKLERLGGAREIAVDIRVVSAAKADLGGLAREGKFREDLAYRLDVLPLELPPLRERGPQDIELLFRRFHQEAASRIGNAAFPVTDLPSVLAYTWPGNVRELRNAAERAALGFDPLPPAGRIAIGQPRSQQSLTLAERLAPYERRELEAALAAGHSMEETAATLGMSRKTLYLKLKEHGLRSDRTEL